jgi:catechol 2,3-dioxygenase-like lactoylglutathione lyase family enzyme
MTATSSPLERVALAQVAIGVRDIDASRRRWAAVLGVDVPDILEVEAGDRVRMTYRGLPSDACVKLAFFDLGGVQLELVEPVGEASIWKEGLDRNGEAVHHLAFWTEDMAKSAAGLNDHGVELVQRADMGEGQYAYFDAVEPLGCILELLESERPEEIESL